MIDKLIDVFDNIFGGYESLPDATPENMRKMWIGWASVQRDYNPSPATKK